MTAATEASPRIAALDILRGVAVMGILAMNIANFAMPQQAYMNPVAYGHEGPADLVAWAVNFVLVDGKMRGLFSFLFGASMLLVIERADARDESPARVHFRRMLWLLLFGLAHFYFIWNGDILTGYACVGMIAYFLRWKEDGALLRIGFGLVIVQAAIFAMMTAGVAVAASEAAQPGASAEALRNWADIQREIAMPDAAGVRASIALHDGSWIGLARHQLTQNAFNPVAMIAIYGWETLAYMLFGMWGLRSGFLTGGWDDARYRKVAAIGFAITIPAYAALAAIIWGSGFSAVALVACGMAVPALLRPVMVAAWAALIILLTRRGGALTGRIAAAGRAAFTNYLGTSILMTGLFYGWGFGLFGDLRRIELWIVVAAMWAVMLLWSKPWLERFRYGPFEWLWRSLSRWEIQPMRRRAEIAAAAA
ncbi:MAG TPA: DUF418 domain-containing protein [Allosphingosinicella sp.]|jgi:uncharacterized protein